MFSRRWRWTPTRRFILRLDSLSGAKLQCCLYNYAYGHYLTTDFSKCCCSMNEYTGDVMMFTAWIVGSILDSEWRTFYISHHHKVTVYFHLSLLFLSLQFVGLIVSHHTHTPSFSLPAWIPRLVVLHIWRHTVTVTTMFYWGESYRALDWILQSGLEPTMGSIPDADGL